MPATSIQDRVAATAYARIAKGRDIIRRVVLLGPAHRIAFEGIAASSATAFATPLGTYLLIRQQYTSSRTCHKYAFFDPAHALEHSLEVQLPFLQTALTDFTLVPLVVGDAAPETVAAVLERLWGGPETLIVISSDLSHYHEYLVAQRLDKATSQAIEALRVRTSDTIKPVAAIR